MSNSKPVFGYWELRALAQPIRHLLAYLNVDHDEKLYRTGEPPNHNIDDWLKEKFTLGLPFPNVPYWIDNAKNVKLTESRAILKYIAREYGPDLLPETSAEHRDADVIDYLSLDIHHHLIRVVYVFSEDAEKSLVEAVTAKFENLSKFLEGKKWVLGNKLSYVDFLLYEVFYQVKVFKAALIEGFPLIVQYMKAFESLPSIAKYMASPGYIAKPCFSVFADYKM